MNCTCLRKLADPKHVCEWHAWKAAKHARAEGMSEARDLTQKQFDSACSRHGFKPVGFFSYYDVGNGVEVCSLNAGRRRRDKLAYLIRESEKAQAWADAGKPVGEAVR
jgi:hypothetical protein